MFFYSGGLGANRNVSGKKCMKLAIRLDNSHDYQVLFGTLKKGQKIENVVCFKSLVMF